MQKIHCWHPWKTSFWTPPKKSTIVLPWKNSFRRPYLQISFQIFRIY